MPEIQLVELDYAILGVLPEEGTVLGFQAVAKQAKGVRDDLNEMMPGDAPKITSAQVNGRLGALHQGGYVVSCTVQPVSRGHGWQRTPKGRRLLEERSAQQDGTTIKDLEEHVHATR